MLHRRVVPWIASMALCACNAAHGRGICDPACTGMAFCCAEHCVDRSTDALNCGACGVTCRAEQVCSAGLCTHPPIDAGPALPDASSDCRPPCGPGSECWCGACAPSPIGVTHGDGRTDPSFANCGACGMACDPLHASRCGPTASGLACFCGAQGPCAAAESCVAPTSGPPLPCDGGTCTSDFTCVSTANDPNHCGQPSVQCGVNETCNNGLCQCGTGPSCSGTGEYCMSGRCVCSASGPCPQGNVCTPTGCVDVSRDPANCGTPGHACNVGETCSAGTCSCGGGPACPFLSHAPPPNCAPLCCAGACVDASPSDCGACGSACADGLSCGVGTTTGLTCSVPRLMPFQVCLHGAATIGARCVGVDCSGGDGACAIGTCDETSGTCITVARPDGTACGAATSCSAMVCLAGSCVATNTDCLGCGPSSVCNGGVCGMGPHALVYDFESGVLGNVRTVVGRAPWAVVSGGAHGGTYSIRSGTITPGASSSIELSVRTTQISMLTFWYRIDGDPSGDRLELFANGIAVGSIAFQSSWQSFSVPSAPAGQYLLELRFTRGATSTLGAGAAFVDDVSITASGPGPVCGQ